MKALRKNIKTKEKENIFLKRKRKEKRKTENENEKKKKVVFEKVADPASFYRARTQKDHLTVCDCTLKVAMKTSRHLI